MKPALLVLFVFISVALARRRQASSSIDACGSRDLGRQEPIPFMRASSSAKKSCMIKAVRTEVFANKKKHACKPREMQVEIPALYDYMYDPSHVSVMRCQGSCRLKVACMATRKQITKIAVARESLTHVLEHPTCGYVEVEEHTMCNCTCQMTKADCTQKQTYMPHSCMCMCNNLDERAKCLSGGVKVWDQTSCQCSCPASQLCSTGQVWNDDDCMCESM